MAGAEARAMNERQPPEYAYHLLRASLEEFKKDYGRLDPAQRQEAERRAERSLEIESLALASSEALEVVIDEAQLEAAFAEVAGRYASCEELADDLARNGFDEEGLRVALRRELRFDAVMRRVGARRAEVNDLDVRLFYELHRDRFSRQERRAVSHLLITINPDFAENRREAARERIDALAEKLSANPARFEKLARSHSECPSALEGGRIGTVSRGELYPVLDAALFAMKEGAISEVVESDVGFHLLRCEKIEAADSLPLAQVRKKIHAALDERNRRNCQKAWLTTLRRRWGGAG